MARSILITGCSSGIGRDAAQTLSSEGWRVFASCRRQADCDALREAGLESPLLDYERPETLETAWVEVMEATGGRLDALFHNGAYAIPGPIQDIPAPAMGAIFQANFLGWHDLTRRAIPLMRARRAGRIVFNSSVLGFVPAKYRGAYIATKHAVEGYCDTLRLELRGTGVHAISIQPGPIDTAFRNNAIAQFERWIDWKASDLAPQYRDSLLDRLYNGSSGSPFELKPSAVTARVRRALEARSPRARYAVTAPTRIMAAAKRILPVGAFDRLCDRV